MTSSKGLNITWVVYSSMVQRPCSVFQVKKGSQKKKKKAEKFRNYERLRKV